MLLCSLGNKTEPNQMTSVKDHVELLHDLLVLCFLSIWTPTPKAKRFIWCQGSLQMSIFVTYFHIPW